MSLPNDQRTVQDSDGNEIPFADIEVRDLAGGLVTIYSDPDGTTEITQPGFQSDANGFYRFYAQPGYYEITVTGPEGARVLARVNLERGVTSLSDITSIADLNTAALVDGQQFHMTGWRTGSDLGGGSLYYDSTRPQTDHDGGTVFALGATPPTDFNDPAQIAAYLNAGGGLSGNGCLVRQETGDLLDTSGYGVKPDDPTFNCQPILQVLADRPITIRLAGFSHYVAARTTLNTALGVTGTRGLSKLLASADGIIPLKSPDGREGVFFNNFELDGQNQGQLNAGLIQINGTKNFRCDRLTLKNGGTIGAASPSGVNGISVAVDDYPSSPKSSGDITNCTFDNFTKAPINWTTFADGGVIRDCVITNCVGNGSCPGIQINGGQNVDIENVTIDGTEGAGMRIATVPSTVPPYPSRNVSVNGLKAFNIGSLGVANSEGSVYYITSSGSTAADEIVKGIKIAGTTAESANDGFAQISGAEDVQISGQANTLVGGDWFVRAEDTVNLTVSNCVGTDIAASGLSDTALVFLTNCSDVSVVNNKIRVVSDTFYPYLVGATSGVNTGLSALDNEIPSSSDPIRNTRAQFFEKTFIKGAISFDLTSGSTIDPFLLNIPDGRVMSSNFYVDSYGVTEEVQQYKTALARTVSGTTTINNSSSIIDYTTAGISGASYDVTGNNLRLRFNNDSAEAVAATLKYQISII